jgi:amino acid adenylation domain-containing protein/non-ribosomal peptide synthase protein (TIGR01720 family)
VVSSERVLMQGGVPGTNVVLDERRRLLLDRLLAEQGVDRAHSPIPRARRDRPAPPSYGQLALWLAEQAQPGSAAYNMAGAFRLRGELSPAALTAAFDALLARHEALRTRLTLTGGRPVQEVVAPRRTVLPIVDLAGVPEIVREDAARHAAESEAGRAFDLASGRLLRCLLLRLGAGDHLLVLTVHHAAADRWSIGVLLAELGPCYAAALARQPSPLPPPTLQFRDYSAWERQRIESGELDDVLAAWREELAQAPPSLELPTGRPRPVVPSGRGLRLRRPLPARLAGGLDDLAAAERATPFGVLLAGYATLLGRLGGVDRVAVGCPVALRGRPEVQRLVGFLVNTLPVVIDLPRDETFRSLVRRTQGQVGRLLARRELPLERLIEHVRPQRDPGRTPIFQVMFAERRGPSPAPALPSVEVEPVAVSTRSAQVDLTLVVAEEEGRWRGEWEASSDLFDTRGIEALAEAFEVLLEAALDEPDGRIADLPLLGAQARNAHRALAERAWSVAPPSQVQPLTVHGPIEEAARSRPHAVAAELGDERLTFGELDARAEALSRRLRHLGAGPEVLVGLCVERSLDLLVGLLGIWKAGGAVVPMEPTHPRERLELLIADAGLSLVVTSRADRPRLPAPEGLRAVEVDSSDDPPAGASPPPVIEAETLAYVIYTSGSTGRPKGVAVAHGPAAAHFAAWSRRFRLGAGDRVYQFASICFDAALEQIVPTLACGARLVLRGPEVAAPDDLVALVVERGLTVLYLPTVFWQQLCQAWCRLPPGAEVGALRLVNPGGDVMPPHAVRRYHASAVGHVPLLNGYGPTEAVVTTAAFEVPPGYCDDDHRRRVPIGAPLDGRVVTVNDRVGRPLPPGVAGEIRVGGPLLARGYLGDPRRTAERFVPDPWSPRPGFRAYRTGDLAVRRADGTLDFLGRIDHQVKVRGFRIELGEVEAALRSLPAVRQAVVAAPEQEPGQRRLVAYVVPRAEADGSTRPEALRQALAERVPEHLVPTAWVLLEALPINSSGKVDRAALPPVAAVGGGIALRDGGGEPADGRERLLARIWSEVLGRPAVGTRANFFSLGGDSILSLQIIARAHERGLRLTPSQFFRYPTIAELAAVATEAGERRREAAASGEVAPMPIQRWFFAQGFAAPVHWNQAQAFDSPRRIEPRWLMAAAAAIFERHDALRSRFERRGSEWRQVIDPPGSAAPASVIDLGALPAQRRGQALSGATASLHRGFDLGGGPVGRLALFRGGPMDRVLLVFHHLVIDGVSWRILLDDLGRALSQAAAGARVELPPRTSSVGRWGQALADLAAAGRFDHQLPFWRQVSGGLEPTADGDPGQPAGRPRRLVLELDREETSRLLTAPTSVRLQVQDLLLAALLLASAHLGRERSLVLELEGHGREDVTPDIDLSRTVGWLTAKYPVRLRLPEDDASPDAVLRTVKEALRRVPDRGLGYGVLRYLAGGERAAELATSASPRLTFNYLGQLDAATDLAWPLLPRFGEQGRECAAVNRPPGPLEVIALVIDGRLRVLWNAREDAGPASELAELASEHLRRVVDLADFCARHARPLATPADFPLARIDQAALDRVLAAVPDVEDLYPLSPVQQGMLFHSLSEPDSGVYVEQLVLDLEGDLDVRRFADCWRQVVARHAVLRTAFLWQGVSQPLQAVALDAEPSFLCEDWRRLGVEERELRLAKYLAEDRERGFELDRPPLLRFLLLREDDERYRLVWTNHHLLVDGWAEPLVLGEVFTLYAAAGRGAAAELPARRPFRDYVEWLERQDHEAARAFWRRSLGDCREPCLLPSDPVADPLAAGHGEEKVALGEALAAALEETARRDGVTANTLVQAAWALLLADYTGRDDVVFGLTLSGRPADMAGADGIVGMFINTLPLRVRIDPARATRDWVHEIQACTGEILGHAHSPLVEAVSSSGVPRGQPLFETLVVCMNQPQDYDWFERPAGPDGPRIRGAHGIEQTNYPLTVTARPGREPLLELNHRLARVGRARARAVLADLEAVLDGLADPSCRRLADVSDRLAMTRIRHRRKAADRLREERRRAFAALRPRSASRHAAAGG